MITLPNTTKPEGNQDAFNRVWEHFIKNNNLICGASYGSCFYRDASGNGCAVGCMLPDDLIRGSSPGCYINGTIQSLINNNPPIREWLSAVDFEFLFDLQRMHDQFNTKKSHIEKEALLELAKRWNLTVPQ